MKKHSDGFTLIELLMAIAIAGILAALAYSSYSSSVMKSNRSEAKTELYDIAQRLQKCYTTYGRYDDPNGADLCPIYEDLTDGTPYITRGRGFYEITISNDTANTYLLTADGANSSQVEDVECQQMTLDHMGQTLPANCW